MQFFDSFAYIRDGISRLGDKDIIIKANESPMKLKESMRKFMKKLEKLNITLNKEGQVQCINH